MIAPLLPCPNCERHVRSTETHCPFCACGLEARSAPLPLLPLPQGRLGSLAIMTFRAAALGAALSACGGNTDDDDDKGGAGRAGASAAGAGGARANPDDSAGASSGGRSGNGGISIGGASFGGRPADGGQVSIYRATPKG
jgi:hypothetical protein